MSYYSPSFLINDMLNLPFSSNVIVVSDSQMAELTRTRAESEIALLQKRLQSYESSAESLRNQITALQTEHGLMPEAPTE